MRVTRPTLSCLVRIALLLACGAMLPAAPAAAQGGPEYRALWVDTFNTPLGTRVEIDKVIAAATASRSNAIFAQIRRRGDSWYLDSLEPLTQVSGVGEPDASGTWTLDPLAYLIDQAHLHNIEVHAFVIMGSIYNAHPTITGVPKDPKHVFNQHFFDSTTKLLYADSDPRQWSTRALPHNLTGTSFTGHRFTGAGEWYIDPGHPDAEAHTVNVLKHLVSRYDLDGLHLDRIRYPEAPIDMVPRSSLTTWGINVGYNETSVNRFKARHGSAAAYYTAADVGRTVNGVVITAGDVGYPQSHDPLWNDWRREQVTNLVRRVYLSATAIKPRLKVSAALICFWTGPGGSGGWEKTEAHYRVFQNWRAWMQEGILDVAAPMIYKREHTPGEQAQFDDWLSFTKSLAVSSGRHAMPGMGAYLNSIEGSLRQARRSLARAPFAAGNAPADGIILYALGDTAAGALGNLNAAVTANLYSYPTGGLNTPKRPNADVFAAVKTSASASGAVLFEDPGNGPLFATTVPTPDMPWKSTPALGHAMGFAKPDSESVLDGAVVTVEPMSAPAAVRTTRSDGGGFFGFVGLTPGAYRGSAVLGAVRLDVCRFDVTPGLVSEVNVRRDTVAPVTSAALDPSTPSSGWYTGDARLTLSAADDCSDVDRIEYSVDGVTWSPYTAPVTFSAEGTTTVFYRAVDRAGNVEASSSTVVRIDKTNPTLRVTVDRNALWPPNGSSTTIRISASATDATAGLATVSYQVVDEYGTPVTLAPRALTGASAEWTESLALDVSRLGTDRDGRVYRVIVTVTDLAGHVTSSTVEVVVAHDQRR